MIYQHKAGHTYKLVNIYGMYSTVKRTKGRPMVVINMYNLDLDKEVETNVVVPGLMEDGFTAVDAFANYNHWEHIIRDFDENKKYQIKFEPMMTNQFGNETPFRVKTKKVNGSLKYIIDADSHPVICFESYVSQYRKPVTLEKKEVVEEVKQFDSDLFEIKT